jgi:hypothetical protein
MQNIYNLHYKLEDIEPSLNKVIEYTLKPVDISEPSALLLVRETGRQLLPVASKCFLSASYHAKRLGVRTGETYALLSSLKDYTEMVKKDLENSLISLSNTINYYKNER